MNIKSILPLIVLLGLGLLAFYFQQDKSSSKNDLDQDWVMHVENADDIHRIFIADRKGGKADLVRDGKTWIYNDKYIANPNVMSSVIEVLTAVRMKNRPTSAAIPTMVSALSSSSTKVEVYNKSNEILKSFYIGGVTPDELGTFMILEGSNNPYVMHMPMNEVSLKTRFFTDVLLWRDKTVLAVNPKDVVSLSLEYPKRKNKSFKIIRNNGAWTVDPLFETTRKIDRAVNQDLVDSYLKEYKKIGAEAFEKRTKRVQKALNGKEFCIVKLLFTDGEKEQINFFPIQVFEDENADQPKPIEKYVTVNAKKDIYITQHLVFKDIFWAYDFFFEG